MKKLNLTYLKLTFGDSLINPILLGTFIFITHFSYAQEVHSGMVIYDVISEYYSNEIETYPTFNHNLGFDGDDDFSQKSILLEFNKFQSICRESDESLHYKNQWSEFKTTSLELLGETYFDSNSGEIYTSQDQRGETFIITKDTTDIKWELKKEIKEILGYSCQKAIRQVKYSNISGRTFTKNYVAWYTLDIPYPFGPFNHINLPGLILAIEKTGGHTEFKYIARELNLNPETAIRIKRPVKGKLISQKEFDEKVSKDLKKILGVKE